MNINRLLSHNRRYYQRYYRLVFGAVVLMMAVLTGSLLLGDSVRGTLSDRVHERLQNAETVIASGTGFFDDKVLDVPLLANARGYLLVEGYVSDEGRLLPVYVWGTDEDTIAVGHALVNTPLSSKLSDGTADIVLHLPSHSLVPSGSLFVTKSYATQMRLHVDAVKDVKHGGNILLKNEQTLPLNIFVNRQQLCEVMELKDKVNIILSDDEITEQEFADVWTPRMSGVNLTDSSLTADRIFIQKDLVERLQPSAKYFSYLVNDIINAGDTVPYSFVTAVTSWKGKALTGHEMVLSDYAARRLNVMTGDTVRMSYFVSDDLKSLQTRAQTFVVADVVPLSEFMCDSLLIAEFPGLSNVEKCTDWDSDLPIKMDRIHDIDEDFWYDYHQTPKAIVAYDAVCDDWGNSFGTATALRFDGSVTANDLEHKLTESVSVFASIRSSLQSAGQYAANNGTDFSTLFMALGFFIIVSAVLLMQNPLAEMFEQRRTELLLYQQLGYSARKVVRMMLREAFGVILLASPFGVVAGMAYSGVTLWLLGNVWSGATHTEGFALHVNPLTVVTGWLLGVIVCAVSLWSSVRKQLKNDRYLLGSHTPYYNNRAETDANSVKSGSGTTVSRPVCRIIVTCLLGMLTIALVIYNFLCLHSMVLFVAGGLMWIVSFGLMLNLFIVEKSRKTASKPWSRQQMMWCSANARRRQLLMTYWTLSIGVFTVFAVGLNRPDFGDADMFAKATGGYDLYVESRVPVQYDLNNDVVREKLSIDGMPDSTRFLSFMRHTEDEASCLNLNKVTTPTVLGVDLEEMRVFGIDAVKPFDGFAVYLDEESLIWSMMKSVGDTIIYTDGNVKAVPVVIAGTYPTGIFHGNAIMSDEDFRELWREESGVEVMLLKSSDATSAGELLSVAMSEYGMTVQTTGERIQMFFEVTDTYLIIFLTLGGLGLMLGIFSMLIIIRKNLEASREAIGQYRVLGFRIGEIRQMLTRENTWVPVYSIITGAVGSVISISANMAGAGIATILLAAVCLAVVVSAVCVGVKLIIRNIVNP